MFKSRKNILDFLILILIRKNCKWLKEKTIEEQIKAKFKKRSIKDPHDKNVKKLKIITS